MKLNDNNKAKNQRQEELKEKGEQKINIHVESKTQNNEQMNEVKKKRKGTKI